MKTILLFGAGKSATVLIDYLLLNAIDEGWSIVIVDADEKLALSKIGNSQRAVVLSFDITNTEERNRVVRAADLVISLLPPFLHILVAKDCIQFRKHLLTASYKDEEIMALAPEIEKNKLLFLYEMGLDPGIDHMSAMKIIDYIHGEGGRITAFRSHCGGLVAPESDDNPWHYKVSWNPRNIVMAGKAGAHYMEDGKEINLGYDELFSNERVVNIPGLGDLCWYPNRDSLSYTVLYGLEHTPTFVRTTLRHADFIYGWKNVLELKLTDESAEYNTDGKTLSAALKEHMDKHGFSEWLSEKLKDRFAETKGMMENLMKLVEAEKEASSGGQNLPEAYITADANGNLEEVAVDDIKNRAAAFVAQKMHEANLTLRQLFFLGLDDQDTIIDKGMCTAADILQFAIERKLMLRPYDKDMIVMLHEFEYEVNGKKEQLKSSLIVKGENHLRTAMAKTVGLPLGIAAKLILNGKIRSQGLIIPTSKDIYEPVLRELEQHEIIFREVISKS